MEIVDDLLKILLPAGLVLYLAYLLVRTFLQKQMDEIAMGIRQKNQETVTPIRLQAYERIILLLERTTPAHLIPRLSSDDYTAKEFQHILIHEIRNEFNHNLSQQLYMSVAAWTYVTSSIEQIISLINSSAMTLDEGSKASELSKVILENSHKEGEQLSMQAIQFIKEEIQSIF